MGYRLSAILKKNEGTKDELNPGFYYGKLYGYTENVKDLLSYKYLEKLGKLTGNEIWDYGFYNRIELTNKQFEKFIEKYLKDLECEDLICYEKDNIKKILESKEEVIIKWV